MALAVTAGATILCSFGMAPSTLVPTPKPMTASSMPAATIMDHAPLVNIPSFGMCTSLANPTVAAATSAALGVLTPMPCIPATATPWVPGSPTFLVGGQPALNNMSKCMCNWGGVISIVQPGQVSMQIP
ncbi:MAG: DUF4280 domain-containing protein [Acidimicrobiales bacterium]